MDGLKKYFWDYNFEEEDLQKVLAGEILRAGHLDKAGLFARILTSAKWYEVLHTIGINNLQEALSESVLVKIKSEDLKRKLRIARGILFK